MFAREKSEFDGRQVDKLIAYFPTDRSQRDEWPIHDFDPRVLGKQPIFTFRARQYRFDPDNRLLVRRPFGCVSPKYEVTVHYFSKPSQFPTDRLKFELPPQATLETVDPPLGRAVRVEGLPSELD